jgi:CBS domain-containing protein
MVGDALRIMRQAGTDVLVIDPLRPGAAYGIVTLRDLLNGAASPAPEQTLVRDVMSTPPFVVSPTMHVEDCVALMMVANVRCAVVMRAGRPIGVIRDTDLFQAIEAGG